MDWACGAMWPGRWRSLRPDSTERRCTAAVAPAARACAAEDSRCCSHAGAHGRHLPQSVCRYISLHSQLLLSDAASSAGSVLSTGLIGWHSANPRVLARHADSITTCVVCRYMLSFYARRSTLAHGMSAMHLL